jgi:hypothetical protein
MDGDAAMTNPDRFAIIRLPDGPPPAGAIAVGPLSTVMEYIPQSLAREKREREADNLAMRSLKIAADTALRADAVIERERAAKAQTDAARAVMSDAIRRFADDVLKLSHRFDQIEQRKIADALRDLPDRDDPQGRSEAEQQEALDSGGLPSAPLPPPHGDNQEAELAIEHNDDQGDLPAELQHGAPAQPGNYAFHPVDEPPRQVPQPTAVGLNAADDAMPAFVCGRDRRAFMRRQRNRTWQR